MGHFSRPARVALAVLALVFALASCDLLNELFDDPFADYRDSSKNLISGSGFEQFDPSPEGYLESAVWTWSWRGDSYGNRSLDISYDYMTLENVGTAYDVDPALGEGLSASSPAYRLSLKNLAPEGGDFETAIDPEIWSSNQTERAPFTIVDSGTSELYGSGSLWLDLSSNKYAALDLYSLRDYDASLTQNLHSYTVRLYKNAGNLKLRSYYADISGKIDFRPDSMNDPGDNNQDPTDYTLSLTGLDLAGAHPYLVMGSNSPIQVFIDDFRIFRFDLLGKLALRLLLRPVDTTPSLTSGYYEFSLWARRPSGYSSIGESNASEPYAASMVSLGMDQLVSSGDASGAAGASFPVTETWTRLVLRMNEDSQFGDMSFSEEAAVELYIMPFDSAYPDPGEVIIAQPELRIFINGY